MRRCTRSTSPWLKKFPTPILRAAWQPISIITWIRLLHNRWPCLKKWVLDKQRLVISMDINCHKPKPELWGGVECTINRVGENFAISSRNWILSAGGRSSKIAFVKYKGRPLSHSVERHQPEQNSDINFDFAEGNKRSSRRRNNAIAGLLHHGSGPAFTIFLMTTSRTNSVPMQSSCRKIPWIEYYTRSMSH